VRVSIYFRIVTSEATDARLELEFLLHIRSSVSKIIAGTGVSSYFRL